MITQDIKNPRLKGWGGFLLIAAIVALILVALELSALVKPYVGALAATVFVWLVGGLTALYVTRRFVVEFRYSADSRRFRVERLYGDRARFMVEIPLGDIVKTGTPEELRAEYPSARRASAVLRDAPLAVLAVAYKDGGDVRLLFLQPDERMRKKLAPHP